MFGPGAADAGSIRRSLMIAVSLSLLVSLFVLPGSASGQANSTKEFTATISPTVDGAGRNDAPYTLTVTNALSSGITLGSANVTVPSGYSDVKGFSVSASGGKSWSASLSLDGGVIELRAGGGNRKLSAGESVVLSFTADTPSSAGFHEWTTEAKPSSDFGGTSFHEIVGPQPTVEIVEVVVCEKLEIKSITDQATGIADVAVVDEPFDVEVQAQYGDGEPCAVDDDTTVSLSATGGTAALGGNTSDDILAGDDTVTIQGVTYPKLENINVCASAPGLSQDCKFLGVTSALEPLNFEPGEPFTVAAGGCTSASPGNICVIVQGNNGADGYLSQGACNGFPGTEGITTPCTTADSLFSVIGNLKDADGNPLYTETNPLVVTILCYKDDCKQKGNPRSGVPFFPVYFQLADGQPFEPLEECATKGVINPNQEACVDIKSSNRSPQGDLMLIVLMKSDPRGRI
jgi:hypothetical protein